MDQGVANVSLSKLGTGAEACIEVKLRDKTKLTGYVSEAGEDSFVIVDEKTGATSTVTYAQVQQVKGNNLSKAAEIALGVGVIVLPIVMVLYFVSKSWSLLVLQSLRLNDHAPGLRHSGVCYGLCGNIFWPLLFW